MRRRVWRWKRLSLITAVAVIVAILSHEVDDTRFVSKPRVPAFR
jgi:hypothetical protein